MRSSLYCCMMWRSSMNARSKSWGFLNARISGEKFVVWDQERAYMPVVLWAIEMMRVICHVFLKVMDICWDRIIWIRRFTANKAILIHISITILVCVSIVSRWCEILLVIRIEARCNLEVTGLYATVCFIAIWTETLFSFQPPSITC